MPTGRVKFFDDVRGFGFIEPDEGGQDIFVHIRNVERAGMNTLAEGQPISFDVMADPKKGGKTAAINLRSA